MFVAFALAQSAMVAHWRRHRESGWRRGLAINLLGAVLSGAVALTAAVTKFPAGAWIVVVLIPLIVVFCLRVHRHYAYAREALTPQPSPHLQAKGTVPPTPHETPEGLAERQDVPAEISHLVVVPVAVLDLAGLRALAYEASLAVAVLALHVCPSRQEDERFRRYWKVWGEHLPLQVVLYSSQRLLHYRTASRLRRTLIHHPGIIITSVPFHLA